MRDKAKSPTLGSNSLSDKIKSLQSLIENSKHKADTNTEDSSPAAIAHYRNSDEPEPTTVAEGTAKFDWQNIELTNELGTDFRSTLTGGVPLKESSLSPELDDEGIPTLETVVFKPSYAPQAKGSPSEDVVQDIEPIIEPEPEQNSETPTQPELNDADAETPVDDLSIPILTDSVLSVGETDSPNTNLESSTSRLPNTDKIDELDPTTANLPQSPIGASSEHSVDFVQDDGANLNLQSLNSLNISTRDDPATVDVDLVPVDHPTLASYSDVTDEILLIIENKLRETIGRTLHPDVLEEIHEELYDLLRDWQEQLETKSN